MICHRLRHVLVDQPHYQLKYKRNLKKLQVVNLLKDMDLTETSPVTHANFIWEKERVKGSVGVPWPDTDSCILRSRLNGTVTTW